MRRGTRGRSRSTKRPFDGGEPAAADERRERADGEPVRAEGTPRARVDGLNAPPLSSHSQARVGAPVAILGFPHNGPYRAEPGRLGPTETVLSQDAYGRGPLTRTITSVRGVVRHGDSGGPAVDGAGRVQTTIFAARVGSTGGYGVPSAAVRQALANAHGPVSTGPCSR